MTLRLQYTLGAALIAAVAFFMTAGSALAFYGGGHGYNYGKDSSGSETKVENTNSAVIVNTTSASSSTGGNYAGGSKGGDGEEGGNGGNGGDAEDNKTNGNNNAGSGGAGGAGGNGGDASDGGLVFSGNATANASTLMVTNTNVTEIEGCGCQGSKKNKGVSEVKVENDNGAVIVNGTDAEAKTGYNKASGSEGGDGEEGGNGGNGGDAEDNGGSSNGHSWKHKGSNGSNGANNGGNGAEGGAGGNGGAGGVGGGVQSGNATSNAKTILVTNTNFFRLLGGSN